MPRLTDNIPEAPQLKFLPLASQHIRATVLTGHSLHTHAVYPNTLAAHMQVLFNVYPLGSRHPIGYDLPETADPRLRSRLFPGSLKFIRLLFIRGFSYQVQQMASSFFHVGYLPSMLLG